MEIITLNVSGHHMQVAKCTLELIPWFKALFSRWTYENQSQPIFVDFDPALFTQFLNWVRDPTYIISTTNGMQAIFTYYGLSFTSVSKPLTLIRQLDLCNYCINEPDGSRWQDWKYVISGVKIVGFTLIILRETGTKISISCSHLQITIDSVNYHLFCKGNKSLCLRKKYMKRLEGDVLINIKGSSKYVICLLEQVPITDESKN